MSQEVLPVSAIAVQAPELSKPPEPVTVKKDGLPPRIYTGDNRGRGVDVRGSGVDVPDVTRFIADAVDLTNLTDPTLCVSRFTERSDDGGATWHTIDGPGTICGEPGGHKSKSGAPLSTGGGIFGYRPTPGVKTMIRARLLIPGGKSLRTSSSFQFKE